ncbi:hypothetical protein JCM10450v2_000101 [Rhodotorula kratochvilovae]
MLSLFTSPVARCTSLVTSKVGSCAYWLAEQAIQSLVTAQNPPPSRTSLASSDFFARKRSPVTPRKASTASRRDNPLPVKVTSTARTPVVKPAAALKPGPSFSGTKATALIPRVEVAKPGSTTASTTCPLSSTTAPASAPVRSAHHPRATTFTTPASKSRNPSSGNTTHSSADLPTVSGLRKKTALRAWLATHASELASQTALKAARVHGEALIAREEAYERALEAAASRSSRSTRDHQRRERQSARIVGQMDAYLADTRGVQPVFALDTACLRRAHSFAPTPSPLAVDCTAAVGAPLSRAALFARASRASIRSARDLPRAGKPALDMQKGPLADPRIVRLRTARA